jgi:UDP-N-acetylglucosamine 1-carboxyvinyltransferase
MDKMRIRGGKILRGTVQASGSKNAALPILISSLLTEDPCTYGHVPNLQDIRTVTRLLSHMGVTVEDRLAQNSVKLTAKSGIQTEAPYDLVRTMRASVVVLGPLLARFGEARRAD